MIHELEANKKLWVGSVFREYRHDMLNPPIENMEYYDYMLVDMNIFKRGVFALVNVTIGSHNRGNIFAKLEGVSTNSFVFAKDLQNYFDSDMKICYLEDWQKNI